MEPGAGGGLKTCPRCGAKLFDDMDVCYGCLYDFTAEHEHRLDVGSGGVMAELLASLDEPELQAAPAPATHRGVEIASGDSPCADKREPGAGGAGASSSEGERLEPVARLVPPTHVKIVIGPASLRLSVPEAGLSFGRSEENDVVVDAASVSARHLEIRMEGGVMAARDLGASNPALLNGWALAGPCSLRMGDRLEIRGAGLEIYPVSLVSEGGVEP